MGKNKFHVFAKNLII